jgi:hypothetical protein
MSNLTIMKFGYIEKLPTIRFLQIPYEYHSIFETSKVVCCWYRKSVKIQFTSQYLLAETHYWHSF